MFKEMCKKDLIREVPDKMDEVLKSLYKKKS